MDVRGEEAQKQIAKNHGFFLHCDETFSCRHVFLRRGWRKIATKMFRLEHSQSPDIPSYVHHSSQLTEETPAEEKESADVKNVDEMAEISTLALCASAVLDKNCNIQNCIIAVRMLEESL